MTDLTLRMFDNELAATDQRITDLQRQAERLAEQLEHTRAELERQETHRRRLEAHKAMLLGEHAPLTPQQISSDEDVLGLRVGPLLLSPPEDATVADLRLHAATMRQLYQQAIHQARLAEDAINDMEPTDDPADDGLEDDELTAPGVIDSRAQIAALTEPPPRYADLIGRPVIVSRLDGRDAGVLVDATADVLRLDDDGTVREISTFLVRTVTLDVVAEKRREHALVGQMVDVTTTDGDRVHGVVHAATEEGLTIGGLQLRHAEIQHVAPAVLPRRERVAPQATPVYPPDAATVAAALDGLRALDDTPDPTATRPDDPAPATGANEEAD